MKKAVSIVAVVMLIAVMAVCLVACAPKDMDAAKAKMEEASYLVVGGADTTAEGLQGSFIATKLKDGGIIAFLFDSKASAKEYVEEHGKYKIPGVGEFEMQQKGKWVYAGSEAAIDVFLK